MTVLRDYAAGLNQPQLASGAGRYDEVIGADGSLRGSWAGLAERAVQITDDDLQRVRGEIERFLADDGVTYRPPGGGEDDVEPWRLDPVPLVLSADDWAPIETGLAQRAELLNAILVDLYGPQTLLSSGVVPPQAVFGHSGFVRLAARASAADERPMLFAAADLGRNADGDWVVTADRAQAPSGIGYAMENRRVISRVLPDLYRHATLHRIAPFFQALRSTLIEAAPEDRPNPRVVVLSPGTESETAYDQAFVASSLGFPLVEGPDLTVRDGAVWMPVFGRLERVDVILRRVDAAWTDALELRKNSQLGVVGLSEAVRRGTVRVVNGLGAGVLENPALLPYLSQMCEVLLDEPLRLPSVQTWWCGDPAGREVVLDRLDELIVRAIDDPGDAVSFAGEQTPGLAERILAAPHRYAAQEPLALSQAPALGPSGVTPQPLTLRTFTVRHGSGYRPLVGGMASVYSDGRPLATKDVWVIKSDATDPDQGVAEVLPAMHTRAPEALVPRVLEDMFWIGRYAERAEDMVRLVLSAHAAAQDFRTSPHSVGGAALSVQMDAIARLAGRPAESGDDADDHDGVFRSVLLDARRAGSAAQAVAGLRQAAQSVRDQLSADTWHALGDVERAQSLLRSYGYSHQIAESATRMLTGVLALQGVTANMMRDPGWHMIGTGRYIERSLQLAYLLRSTAVVHRGNEVDEQVHTAVLAVSESVVTHRRRFFGYVRLRGVLDLLLQDAENPRSIAFGLERLREHLAAMPESSGSTRPERLLDDLVETVSAVDVAELAVVEGERRVQLEQFLDVFTDRMTAFATAVGDVHFAAVPVPRVFGFATVQEG